MDKWTAFRVTRCERRSIVAEGGALEVECSWRSTGLHCLSEMLNIPLQEVQEATKPLWCTSGIRIQAGSCDNREPIVVTLTAQRSRGTTGPSLLRPLFSNRPRSGGLTDAFH